MFLIILLLLGLTERMCKYISFAEGILELRNNNGGEPDCVNNQQITKTQQFPGTFFNMPQIIISLQKYDLETSNQANGFILTYTPSLTSFDATIKCTTPYKVLTLSIRWMALDDNRIRVLNLTHDATSPQSHILNHDLTNAQYGFLSMIHFQFTSGSQVRIEKLISEITSTDVTVLFRQSPQQIGIQVIIGTKDAMTLIEDVGLGDSSSGFQSEKIVAKQSKYNQYHNCFGSCQLVYTLGQYMTYEIANVETNTSITFKFSTNSWTAGLHFVQYYFMGISNINYMVNYPLLCTKVRISKKKQYIASTVQLYFQVNGDSTTSQTINTANQQTVKSAPGQYETLDLVVSIRCTPGKKIVGQVMICIDCKEQNHELSAVCYGGINYVEYRIKLYQRDKVYQQVTFDISESYVKITQLVTGPNGNLLSLELL